MSAENERQSVLTRRNFIRASAGLIGTGMLGFGYFDKKEATSQIARITQEEEAKVKEEGKLPVDQGKKKEYSDILNSSFQEAVGKADPNRLEEARKLAEQESRFRQAVEQGLQKRKSELPSPDRLYGDSLLVVGGATVDVFVAIPLLKNLTCPTNTLTTNPSTK
jgi:hypothetical protein